MVSSAFTLNTEARSSTLTYVIGAVTRNLVYTGGRVTLPAITVPHTFSLADFTWLHSEVRWWLTVVSDVLDPPVLQAAVTTAAFTVGAYHAPSQTYAVSLVLGFRTVGDGTEVLLTYSQLQGTVTLASRPASVIAWTSLEAVNEYVAQLVLAANTGKRFE